MMRPQALFRPGVVTAVAALILCAGCGTSDVDEELERARHELGSGAVEEAIHRLRGLVASHPASPDVRLTLGRAYLQAGDPTLATWHLSRAARSEALAEPASLLLAYSRIASADYDGAVAALDRAIEVAADVDRPLRIRALAHAMNRNARGALRDVKRASALGIDEPDLLAIRAIALWQLERREEALDAIRALHHRGTELDPRIEDAVCVAHARALDETGVHDEAVTVLTGCLRRNPTSVQALEYALASLDPEEATARLERANGMDPSNRAIRLLLVARYRDGDRLGAAAALLEAAARRTARMEPWLDLARFRRSVGELEKARIALERGLASSGEHRGTVAFELADLLIEAGELARARELVSEIQPPHYASLLVGRLHFAEGRPAEALEALTEGLELWPDNPGARLIAGRAAEQLGDLERAISEYREAVRSDDGALAAERDLARAHASNGEYDAALGFLMDYLDREPRDLEAAIELIRVALQVGRVGLARRTLDLLREIGAPAEVRLLQTAIVEQAASGSEAALRVIDAAPADLSDPAYEDVLRHRVQLLVDMGRADLAVADVTELARRPNAPPHVHDVLGRVLFPSDPSAALEAFDRALELDAEYAYSLAGKAEVLASRGGLDAAVGLLDRAAALLPQDPELSYRAAQLAGQAGIEGEPEARLRRLVARDPGHTPALNDLAWVLAESDAAFAVELARRAARIDPQANTLDTLGWVLATRGENDAAVAALRRAHDLDPDSPAIQYRLGRALTLAGDLDGAAETFGELIATGDAAHAELAKAALASLSAREIGR